MADNDSVAEKAETIVAEQVEGEIKPETTETNEAELAVTIEGASPTPAESENDSSVLRDIRTRLREQIRLNKEQAELIARSQPKPMELGVKPTMESCNYEEEKFETALTQWHTEKRKLEEAITAKETEAKKSNETWLQSLNKYGTQKEELKAKVKGVDKAEEVAKDTLSTIQQSIIIAGCENSAMVIHALGTNEAEARKLASEKDPIKFAFAVARLEGKLKLTPKPTPTPEKTIKSGGASLTNAAEKELERLRAAGDKTGDYTEVIAYRSRLKREAARK